MSSAYVLGTAPIARARWQNVDGDAFDPTTVTFFLLSPDRSVNLQVASPDTSITNPEVGTWDFQTPPLMQAGKWYVRAEAAGGIDVALEKWFHVKDSVFY